MKLKCVDCGEKIDLEDVGAKNNFKFKIVKIGNCYHCIKCRGFKFLVVEL